MWTKWCLKDSLTSPRFCSTNALNSSMRSLCVAMARPCHDGAKAVAALACAAAAAFCAACCAAATVAIVLVGAAAAAVETMGLSAAAAVRLNGLWLKGLTLKE